MSLSICLLEMSFNHCHFFTVVNREKFKDFVNELATIKVEEVSLAFVSSGLDKINKDMNKKKSKRVPIKYLGDLAQSFDLLPPLQSRSKIYKYLSQNFETLTKQIEDLQIFVVFKLLSMTEINGYAENISLHL